MDQKCVICKSATYHEHDTLTSSLRKQFWQMTSMRMFIWGDWDLTDMESDENIQLLACPVPSNRYITLFLKKYIEKIESMPDYELDDELTEFYISLISTTNTTSFAPGMCYKTYVLDKEQYMRIVLQEEQTMVSQGTTGLQTWDASLRLADFFAEHPGIIRGQRVVELGAGCGLAGFTCAAMGASNVLSTDFNSDVLKLLEGNRQTNTEYKDKVQVAELDWANLEECARISSNVDVIIGADVSYDPTIVPLLVAALETMLVSPQQVAYITAAVRSQETFELFLKLVDDTGVLGKSVMDLTEAKMSTLCLPNPVSDIRLILITRK
ncbi:putative methyltransferase-domain-containing protein [Kickxella alabastrina]|uniref:putative methyltransferase-domain-containing protein n=1 Tax=Kickxella alabastrina TaxID=61397 RepID=UPI002220259D|nr:putative methyltransferase-domain-containing protein [Kickxella alabastrina]KAI7822075.1 putative methyltransferase-domain-containing protein [Kickxella alabastrina]